MFNTIMNVVLGGASYAIVVFLALLIIYAVGESLYEFVAQFHRKHEEEE